MIGHQDIVIASNEITKNIHRELFHLSEECYILMHDRLIGMALYSFCKNTERLHLALNWADMLRFGTAHETPSKGDIILLLKKIGVSTEELHPFVDSLNDILAYLYYGKRFDVLRRLCSETKRNLERNIKGPARVNCHLIYEETRSIIASSL